MLKSIQWCIRYIVIRQNSIIYYTNINVATEGQRVQRDVGTSEKYKH